VSELEAIARALAECDGGDLWKGVAVTYCVLCVRAGEQGGHAWDCPYRRAVEWVAAHPKAAPARKRSTRTRKATRHKAGAR
jgi:hypothetical protein